MSIFEAGAALRTWAARQGLAPSTSAAQVAEFGNYGEYVDQFNMAFSELSAPTLKAVNMRKVHAVAVNEATDTIVVYVNKAFSAKQIELIPNLVGGFKVSYRQGVVGQIGGVPPSGVGSPSHYLHNGRISCGSSIGMGGGFAAGTLGALVRVNDDLYGLSNNHVIGRCSYAEGGHPILAPGNIDINPNFLMHPFSIGVYEMSAPFVTGSPATVNVNGNLDASLMRIVDEAKVSAMQGNSFVTPSQVADLRDGMHVKKVGRTTGQTTGVVAGKVAGYQAVGYTVPEIQLQFHAFFNEAWIIEGTYGSFSEPGDSGALVVGKLENGEEAAVGLVFAGGQNISFIVPLGLILDYFGATLEANHGV